jgi:signal transduction histidine kinase
MVMSIPSPASSLSESWGRLLVQPPPGSHLVQFYEDQGFLAGAVTEFVAAGLRGNETLVVVADEPHRQAFERSLASRGLAVGELVESGQLTLLDARETLAGLMVEGMPDRSRFLGAVGGLMNRLRARRPGAPVRAYGEMVDLLWRDGNPGAATALEGLWNELGETQPLTLLCAYSMNHFFSEAHSGPFRQVCAAHSHVIPDGHGEQQPEALLREIGEWQQRARALDNEIAERTRLEAALRSALAERRQVEEELRRQNDELARTVRFSEVFVGILGHDLRNPLSAVTTAASLLVRRADSDRVARPAARILSSGQRMSRMIDQLLDFTRIRLGKGLSVQRAQVDLAEVGRMVLDDLTVGEERPQVRTETAGDLVGWWDGDRLGQLLSNLLGNALAHGDRSGGVTLSLDGRAPHEVVVTVGNAGVISDDLLAQLFDPARSATTLRREGSSGLGLGLYISQQIVLSHGGALEVSSSPGQGTLFIVKLPRDLPPVYAASGAPQ